MSTAIPGVTYFLLDKKSQRQRKIWESLVNALYFSEKLTGGTGAFVRFCGSLRLEVSLHLLGVLRRGGLSVVGRHVGDVGRCAYLVPGFMRIEPRR